jgi:hypothetical protein
MERTPDMLQRRTESCRHINWHFQALQYYIFSTIAQIVLLVCEIFLKYQFITSASTEYKFKCF